ncbi:MAG: hypothetical protein Q8Q07_00500 [Dehalococcoidales bacterium]|nr:hypothetical protein [Dehalococcoidales bacterium]
MPADIQIFEKVTAEQDSNLEAILTGIVDGIMEGVKEGVSDGLRKGIEEGLKGSLSGDLGSSGEIDFREVIEDILEDTARTTLRESTKNIVSRPAEIYMRGICSRLVIEITQRNIKLTESEIRQLKDVVTRAEKQALSRLSDRLPDNPFIKEIAGGIQAALEDSLQKELESCQERLRNAKTHH